jgi:hypothetical protein
LQLDGSIGVLGLLLFRAFQFVVFLFTIIYGVSTTLSNKQLAHIMAEAQL